MICGPVTEIPPTPVATKLDESSIPVSAFSFMSTSESVGSVVPV